MDCGNLDFDYYRKLLIMEKIAERYGQPEEILQKIHETQKLLTAKRYRVAVIGEFKRGKSSMINALLGAEVLPTDVAPATGTRNRIVFGTEKGIEITYKDGKRERRPLEDLRRYGTKLDEESAANARRIREIVVTYPSIFSQNRFEIIDTPGLNDDEETMETTLDVLDELDAAIVVISAQYPYSMTERDMVLRLIGKKDIRHITFVVTFIDAVSNRREIQDRSIQYIKKMITNETLQMAEEHFQNDAGLLKKARQILSSPEIFPVSSTQAMEAFVKDDQELLELSRFPKFKSDIQEMLIREQSEDVAFKVSDIARQMCTFMETVDLQDMGSRLNKMLAQLNCFMEDKTKKLEQQLLQIDDDFQKQSIMPFSKYKEEIGRCFIRSISQMRTSMELDKDITVDTEVTDKLGNKRVFRTVGRPGYVHILHGAELSEQVMQDCQAASGLYEKLEAAESAFVEMRKSTWVGQYLPEEEHVLEEIRIWHSKNGAPLFRWGDDLSQKEVNKLPPQMDVMPWVAPKIDKAVDCWILALVSYLALWRVLLLRLNAEDVKKREYIEAGLRQKYMIDTVEYKKNLSEVRDIYNELCHLHE